MAQLVGLILLVDGMVTAICGRRFLWWQRRYVPDWYKLGLDALLDWPEPLLRAAALGEAALGAWWLLRQVKEGRSGH
jgi:hypothetical protein